MGPIPVFLTLTSSPKGLIIFLWIKQARFYPRENKQFCNKNVCGPLFHWAKAGSSASSARPASPEGSVKELQLQVLGRNRERENWHVKYEMMTALNRFPQHASETAIRDGDWQGIPSSTLLPSLLDGTIVSPKAGSYGDFKEDKTDPFVNLHRRVIQHRSFPPWIITGKGLQSEDILLFHHLNEQPSISLS